MSGGVFREMDCKKTGNEEMTIMWWDKYETNNDGDLFPAGCIRTTEIECFGGAYID
jgi:hypothetical protein